MVFCLFGQLGFWEIAIIALVILLLFGALWPRFNSSGAFVGALVGMITMVVFTLLGTVLGVFDVGQYIYLASLGFIVTIVAALIGSLFGKRKYYGQRGWERIPNDHNRENVTLEDMDYEILKLIRAGHLYMADITDTLGVDSKTSGAAVERLDRGGYIIRAGMIGSKFYTFDISDKGLAALPPVEGKEAEMLKDKLTPMYVELLDIVKNRPEHQAEFVQKHQIKSMHMAAISSHLTRQGYIKEGGLFKRKLRITEKGAAAVAKYAA